MTRLLSVRDRQRVRAVDTSLLRRTTLHLLKEHFRATNYELAIHLIGGSEMAQINESFLQHKGSTDVITFCHSESPEAGAIQGEIFVCLDEAVAQAREFGTTWQSELVRYIIHGLLHLHGHDDRQPAARRKMKREENCLLRAVSRRFFLRELERRRPKRGGKKSAVRNRPIAI